MFTKLRLMINIFRNRDDHLIIPINLKYKLFFFEFDLGRAAQKISLAIVNLSPKLTNCYGAILTRKEIAILFYLIVHLEYSCIFQQAYEFDTFSKLFEFYVPLTHRYYP